ncbi:glycerol-3-phosphate acyltransferase [Acidaminobacter hydrogenoformans]|uniref:Glycerol-3-phosphate acyltransferase PlsY n=1 Tax=Acidaminobacter hydrogenoformans DSM 2784 TaxID=1120920 RepID=A0A1G5RVL2_9FIRM|nr:glycerol-3-phosphate acyltransferase [Acidaminobacter hydrogenoformans]SCZ78093.1 glycerol-3-phosphate acyltransferase PlsY [Acidaminobacter hydrogenoformans DSM 2784]
MASHLIFILTIVCGYLIGSISFARIVFAILKPGEPLTLIRTPTTDAQAELVSHAVGATNVMIAFGPRWGIMVSVLDALKAFLPTLIIKIMIPEAPYYLLAAVAVLVGHLWPVWHRFSGGGGNSSIMGMMLAISPVGLLVTHAGGMLFGRFAPMFSFVGGVALTIPWFAFRNGLYSLEVVFALTITILYVLAELPEIMQLRKLTRQGHTLDNRHVVSMMKKSVKIEKPGNHHEDQGSESE